MSEAIVLAIVGLSGVGKSQAVKIVSEWLDFEVVYFGGVVLDEVKATGLEVTPANESLVRESLRRDFGMDVMATRSLPAISRAVASGRHVLIDGLYSQSEYVLLQRHLAGRLKTIAIHSDKSGAAVDAGGDGTPGPAGGRGAGEGPANRAGGFSCVEQRRHDVVRRRSAVVL
jgi:hypothetical protein